MPVSDPKPEGSVSFYFRTLFLGAMSLHIRCLTLLTLPCHRDLVWELTLTASDKPTLPLISVKPHDSEAAEDPPDPPES